RFRDGTCVWPGCDLPGDWCDADHALDHTKQGRTAVTNGRFLCRRHHHMRDRGWQVDYDPNTRACSVTSPLGITWHSGPDPPGRVADQASSLPSWWRSHPSSQKLP